MPPYDSDSSGDEDDVEYTKTSVILGFAASDSGEAGDSISHLGGSPVCYNTLICFIVVVSLSIFCTTVILSTKVLTTFL